MDPFLPWPGSKAKCAEEIIVEFPRKVGTYFEPFLGSGAVYFALNHDMPMFRVEHGGAVLADVNKRVVGAWRAVRDEPENTIEVLNDCMRKNTEEFYFKMRPHVDEPGVFLYLMRAGFSSMYRENKAGEFNVPWRKGDFLKGRRISVDTHHLLRCSERLNKDNATVCCMSYELTVSGATRGDLVYFDPPYLPYNETGFVAYSKDGFGVGDHVMLKNTCERLRQQGVFVALSNSDCEASRRIYGPPTRVLRVTNSVNAKAKVKGTRPEGLWLYRP